MDIGLLDELFLCVSAGITVLKTWITQPFLDTNSFSFADVYSICYVDYKR